MLEERFQEALAKAAFKRNKPFLVKTQPSPVVRPIEDFVQGDFGPIPDETVYTARNKAGLILHAVTDSWLRSELWSTFEPRVSGQYLPTYHLYLVKGESRIHTRYHEAGHALARNINPLAMRIFQGRFGPLSKFKESSPIYEMRHAFRCAGEGFAEWVAQGVVDRNFDSSVPERTEGMEKVFRAFERGVDYETKKWLFGNNFPDDKEAEKALMYAPYIYGAYFVANVIHELEGQGMSRFEAVNKFLLDQPVNVRELSDPQAYARHILLEERTFSAQDIASMEGFSKLFLGD